MGDYLDINNRHGLIMGTYKEIRGTHIVSVTSDPPSPVNGQMWYNSTDKVIKGFTSNPAGAWATGTSVNTARQLVGEAGSQTQALLFGGQPNPAKTETESWNGTSWTEVNDLNVGRNGLGSAGTYTSALGFGGEPGTVTPKPLLVVFKSPTSVQIEPSHNSVLL